MNAEHTSRLFEDFPSLYVGRHLPPSENLMSFGFCCGDGWFELIYDLSQQIEHYNCIHPETAAIAIQVKEKFGGLRFYVDQATPELAAIIAEAERRSLQTCAITGQPGKLYQSQGYYLTLCVEKARELGFEPT